jgi:hypothetical protein
MCGHSQKLTEAKAKLNQQVLNVESKLKTKAKKHIGFIGSYRHTLNTIYHNYLKNPFAWVQNINETIQSVSNETGFIVIEIK